MKKVLFIKKNLCLALMLNIFILASNANANDRSIIIAGKIIVNGNQRIEQEWLC